MSSGLKIDFEKFDQLSTDILYSFWMEEDEDVLGHIQRFD